MSPSRHNRQPGGGWIWAGAPDADKDALTASKLQVWGGEPKTASEKAIVRTLSELGGERVAWPRQGERDADIIAKRGFADNGAGAKAAHGDISRCHINVAKAYRAGEIDAIATGYALTDGVWRPHSWGYKGKTIIETTDKREKYFGAKLTKAEARQFVEAEI